ncbi:hypothetical protein ACOMHN_018889 [Nucella lapillus]
MDPTTQTINASTSPSATNVIDASPSSPLPTSRPSTPTPPSYLATTPPQRPTTSSDFLPLSTPPPRVPSTSYSSPSSPQDDHWWTGKYDLAAKIIVLGDYGVGKSTLLSTLGGVRDMGWCRCVAFKPNEYVEMECSKNEKKILIRLMDTGGQERFRSMTSSYFRGAHGCLLMFKVTNENSFNNVVNWYNDLGVYAPAESIGNFSAIVVGNTSCEEHERRITAERAYRLAESLSLTYCETHVRDEQTALCILTRLVNNIIVNRVRRQSLAITIMPSIQDKARKRKSGGSWEKRRWVCCKTS